MKIVYFAGGYIGNIGNAFIELGGLEILKRSLNQDDELYVMNPGDHEDFCGRFRKGFFRSLYRLKTDIAVFSGMLFCKGFFLPKFIPVFFEENHDCKLLFMGAGVGDTIGQGTTDDLLNFHDRVTKGRRFSVVSRDVHAYEFFKDKTEEVHRGIDAAAFLSMIPIPKIPGDFRVVGDAQMPSRLPDFDPEHDFVLQHARLLDRKDGIDYSSMSPLEYLYIIGNARCVCSNRIHGIISALALGRPAKFYPAAHYDRHDVLNDLPIVHLGDGFMIMDKEKLTALQGVQIEIVRRFLHS